jgi:signal transduction histidine kinase
MKEKINQQLTDISTFNSWLNKAIYDDNTKIDGLLISLCKKLIEVHVAQQTMLLAIKNGSTLCLYDSNIPNENAIRRVDSIDTQNLTTPDPHTNRLSGNKIEMFCQVIFQDRPLFILQSHLEVKDEYIDVLNSVADKINFAFSIKEERRFDRVQKTLIEEFFDKGLQTQEAWKVIAKYSTQFLPDFAPFVIQTPAPLSQILTYKQGDLHLLMRASQSGDPAISEYNERLAVPLKVDETICGILLEKKLDFLLTNPAREYPERYQAYLFHKQLAKSELVLPIKYADEVIAIINIEHPDESVFTDYCVETISRAAKSLAPLVKAVIDREERQRRKEISLLYVMTEVLSRMASVYRHKIGQLLLKSRSVIEDLTEDYAHDPAIQQELNNLRDFINDFDGKSKAFLTELPNYIKYQRIGISFAISEAVKELDAVALEKNREIKIVTSYPLKEIDVYASPMLKEHIYNLVNNAVLTIQQRIAEKKQSSGIINIAITYQEVTDTMEKITSPSRVFVEISDNGGGVPEEDYPHILKFGYTTRREKGGTGYGLPSAREYIQSVQGGDFKTENKPGIGFSVKFFLQEFDPSFHLTVMK